MKDTVPANAVLTTDGEERQITQGVCCGWLLDDTYCQALCQAVQIRPLLGVPPSEADTTTILEEGLKLRWAKQLAHGQMDSFYKW